MRESVSERISVCVCARACVSERVCVRAPVSK